MLRWLVFPNDEQKSLDALAKEIVHITAGTELMEEEEDGADNLYIVKSGRLFSSQALPDGVRAITRLYFSGDIIGTASVPFRLSVQTVTASAHSELYRFPRDRLANAFLEYPRIAAMFYTFAALENAILQDRLVSIGRTEGLARIAAIIMEIATRRAVTGAVIEDPFTIGLTQSEIGDAVGLTQIHVNRLMKELDARGLIRRTREQLTIIDAAGLAEVGHFQNRYKNVDVSWFPGN